MNSRTILRVLAAPLLISFLSGCGNDKRTLQAPASPYTGTWIKESAFTAFEMTRNNINSFCSQIRNLPSVNQTGLPTTLEVRPNGDVYNYLSQSAFADPKFRSENKLGHVTEDGRFNDPTVASFGNANDAKFIRSDSNRLLFWSGSNSRTGNSSFVKIQTQDLNQYVIQISQCYSTTANVGQQSGNWQSNEWQGDANNYPPQMDGAPQQQDPNRTYLPPQQPGPMGQPSQGQNDFGNGYDNGGNNNGYQFGPAPAQNQGGYPGR